MDTISFGVPTGSSRKPCATMAVPPEPPMPSAPTTSLRLRAIHRAKATPMAATAVPRSPVNTAASPPG